MRRIKALLDPDGLLNPASSSATTPTPTWPTSNPCRRAMPSSIRASVRILRAVCPRAPCRCRRASIVLYRELARRNRADEPSTSWPGCLTIRASTPAPRPGCAPIAARWASIPDRSSRNCAAKSTNVSCPSPAGRRSLRRRYPHRPWGPRPQSHCRQAVGRQGAGRIGERGSPSEQPAHACLAADPAGAEPLPVAAGEDQ